MHIFNLGHWLFVLSFDPEEGRRCEIKFPFGFGFVSPSFFIIFQHLSRKMFHGSELVPNDPSRDKFGNILFFSFLSIFKDIDTKSL